jgi:hypothetical protein
MLRIGLPAAYCHEVVSEVEIDFFFNKLRRRPVPREFTSRGSLAIKSLTPADLERLHK